MLAEVSSSSWPAAAVLLVWCIKLLSAHLARDLFSLCCFLINSSLKEIFRACSCITILPLSMLLTLWPFQRVSSAAWVPVDLQVSAKD